MAALTAPVEYTLSDSRVFERYPCSSLTVKKGALIGRASSGLAVAWSGTAGETLLGIATASVAAASAIDVDTNPPTLKGTSNGSEAGINVTGSSAATNNGAPVYSATDNLADSTLTEGAAVAIGKVVRWISGALCWIKLDTEASRLSGGILSGDIELTTGGAIDINGIEDGFILDADADTGIDSPTDDTMTFKAGGVDVMVITAALVNIDYAIDHDVALTAAGAGTDLDVTINHATAAAVALDVSIAQITTVRTSGTVTAIKAAITSLTGDTAGVDYYAFEAAVTVGAAADDHFVLKQGAGFDESMDCSACATTEAGVLVGANLADAWHWKTGSLTYSVLKTTTATPGIAETFTVTATSSVHSITTTVNSAAGVVSGLLSAITTATTTHTSGTIAAITAQVTSLAADSGGVFCGLQIVSTDGGGSTPTHAGIYCASPLDALVMVDATGSGAVVVGAMTAKNPESDTEAGYFSIRVGATRYEVPFYAIA